LQHLMQYPGQIHIKINFYVIALASGDTLHINNKEAAQVASTCIIFYVRGYSKIL
jgi:hypothetical protein